MICSPNYVDMPSEHYYGIACRICTMLAEGQHTDPDKSVLIRAGIKLDHPETYVGGSDFEEFEVFIAGILRWLKMNIVPVPNLQVCCCLPLLGLSPCPCLLLLPLQSSPLSHHLLAPHCLCWVAATTARGRPAAMLL